MPIGRLIRYRDDGSQCWSRVDTVNGDNVWISVAYSHLLVKNSNIGLFGRKLFEVRDPDIASRILVNIDLFFCPPAAREIDDIDEWHMAVRASQDLPPDMREPILRTLTWAAMNCSSCDSLAHFFATPELRYHSEDFLTYMRRVGW